ncbi:MAG: chromosome partitioning protein ParA, partial [Rhodospirillaceae bacterium]|nr:chromosome partitioning protein ParA [Rhodospirillaceae bacterium]
LTQARTQTAEAEAEAITATSSRDMAEAARADTDAARSAATTAFAEADAAHRRLQAEIEALDAILSAEAGPSGAQPVLDRVRAEVGFEAAAAALLDHGADAPEDDATTQPPRAWRTFPPLINAAPPPADLPSLAIHIEAPTALHRRLSLAFLVTDAAEGDRLAPHLCPGQCLLTRDGGLWRWDGFTVRPGAPSAAAKRLEQGNRLRALQVHLPQRQHDRDAAITARDTAIAAATTAQDVERAAREAARTAESRATQARSERERLQRETLDAEDRLNRLTDSRFALLAEHVEAEAALSAITEDRDDRDLPAIQAAVATTRDATAAARANALNARAARDANLRETEARRNRLTALETEDRAWTERQKAAREFRDSLTQRHRDAEVERASLRARPQEMSDRRTRLTTEMEAAEQARRAADDSLAIKDSALRAADARQKEADRAAATAREDRVRAEATLERRSQACHEIEARCREYLNCTMISLDASIDPRFAEMSATEIMERAERRTAERERLGPVNLRAEIEADDVGKQIEGLITERTDLLSAIARLRQGIAELNREGQARLQRSFETVNQAFQEIFTTLFGGGRAYLSLIENDDPLAAGLEIMASPPGKRLQLLSLLSGGEQALTALALLFAVFHSNPAPICILDEVDAPLDDANVDRFCTLLTEMTRDRQTRFLVITHHRMTMARMDRLFGVTMAERGISQLVSVDLKVAETFHAQPSLA